MVILIFVSYSYEYYSLRQLDLDSTIGCRLKPSKLFEVHKLALCSKINQVLPEAVCVSSRLLLAPDNILIGR